MHQYQSCPMQHQQSAYGINKAQKA